ncbi:hypothetical protein FRC08_003225 [Ceratobasidium sp. 394]|nr:hypothetical protein FRC08_003225 [Ceratobasidium sp. 394]
MITISGVISNIASYVTPDNYVASPAYSDRSDVIERALEESNKILKETKSVLKIHNGVLEPADYEAFWALHRTYRLNLADGGVRLREIQENVDVGFDKQAEMQALSESVKELKKLIATFGKNVISTSRAAGERNTPADAPLASPNQATDRSPANVQVSTSSAATWVASSRRGSEVLGTASATESRNPSTAGNATGSQPAGQPSCENAVPGQNFETNITHVPVNSSSGDRWYHRIFSFATPNRHIHIMDRELHQLQDDEVNVDDDALLAISELGQRLMGRLEESRTLDHWRRYVSMEDAIENLEDFGVGY